ncbi:PDR/VanB family oxidoreductase [Erwinia sp. HDF1-3R]|uniref:PDR/VanB family oxidoreductase n=1 Tax=Erwinia sp. HDF1-3R TaxID=3141543 RepID=UPI0031F4C5AA
MMNRLRVVVDALIRQGRNNLAVHLVAEDGQPLPEWQPGAHIDLHLDNGLTRQYSLTGPGRGERGYVICVARESHSRGGSRYIHDSLRPGQVVTVSPPRNVFPLAAGGEAILVAAGIGITPLFAMVEALEASATPFVLHYYVREKHNAAFVRELSRTFRHGRCHIWYSSEGHSPRGHLPPELLSADGDRHLYLCGPEGFMDHMRRVAAEQGWPESRMHSEAFLPPSLPAAERPDDAFTVTLASTGQCWPVSADKSIACVLQENGVNVPLSCEMGMCGACLTGVIAGAVDHRDTVQSTEEKAAPVQQIALCCSRSHSPNLILDL